MPWLLRDGEVLASAEVATSRQARRRGLLGRDGIDGVLLLQPARSVHTVAMRFPLDVAYCRRAGDDLEVLDVASMPPWRIGMPRLRACCVLEAERGAFARWGLRPGDVLQVT
jgi:uncharacterized membrane protein (UPF0127 family)